MTLNRKQPSFIVFEASLSLVVLVNTAMINFSVSPSLESLSLSQLIGVLVDEK